MPKVGGDGMRELPKRALRYFPAARPFLYQVAHRSIFRVFPELR
jgi:hypothetical protein